MKLSSYLNPKCIYFNLEGKTKEDIIIQMIEKTAKNDKTFNESSENIKNGILAREKDISTAIGNGIAIPHARVEGYDDVLVSIGILKTPIKCEIANLKKNDEVKIFFMITTEILKSKVILKIMSSISKTILKDPELLKKILGSKNPQEVYSLLADINVKVETRITAEDVMDPSIKAVSPKDTLNEIARRFIIEEKPGFPVVGEDGEFLGEMTERELIAFGMPDYTPLMENLNFFTIGEPFENYLKNEKTSTIEKIYRDKEHTIIIDKKTPIMEICLLMVNKGYTRMYVVEDGKYYGTILRSHIIKKVLHI